jgi:hypothetical protein
MLTDECQTVSVETAGKILGLSRATAYSLANQNLLPGCFRCGRRFVVSMRVLEKLLDDGKIPNTSQLKETHNA